jgi:hypothetical protein
VSAHAVIAPSSLGAIVQCPAYVRMVAPYADAPRTPEQLEGDAGHWVALQAITTGEILPVGAMTPQGLPVDYEMAGGARLWAETLGGYGIAELPIACPSIHPTQCWGTPDWRRYDPIEGVIRVADYKFGHRFVEVFECWQLIAYLSGVLDEMNATGLQDQHLRFEAIIVQPRSYHRDGPVRRWTGMASDLRGLINIAAMAAEEALKANAPARTGPACLDCDARHECRALQEAALNYADSHVVTGNTVTALPPDALGAELALLQHIAKMVDARVTGLQQQAVSLLSSGQRVPGYSLMEQRAREAWLEDPSTVAATAEVLGFNVRKPLEVMTPNQARATGVPADIVAMYSHRPRGSMKLERDTTTQARKVFGANSP